MKFQSFIFGFIQSYNPIDLYKISLTFTEEFTSLMSRKSNMQLNNIKFFTLFDNLYYKTGCGRIDVDVNVDCCHSCYLFFFSKENIVKTMTVGNENCVFLCKISFTTTKNRS